MSSSSFNRATHFSIVWAVTLVVMTMLEWRSLDRDPLGQEIFSPFISRSVAIPVEGPQRQPEIQFEDEPLPTAAADRDVRVYRAGGSRSDRGRNIVHTYICCCNRRMAGGVVRIRDHQRSG